MPTPNDILNAKQALSSQLLRAHVGAQSIGEIRRPAMRVTSAVTNAGRNVHAVGVGLKIVEGKPTHEQCVRLYVVQKVAPSLLSPRDRLPDSIDGVPTDVIESAPARIYERRRAARGSGARAAAAGSCTANRQKRQRPVVAGISTAHVDVTAGTLACFCRSLRHGDDPNRVFVLGNNHVFANVNQASIGDDLYQPGPIDGGVAADHFADLHRFVRIELGGSNPNRVDAAIGALRQGVTHSPEICSIGKITGTRRAAENMVVRKHGRTSGLTKGEVDDIAYDAVVGMDHQDPDIVALFQNQIRIRATASNPAFGLGGDSGSLVVHGTAQEAVGLYFAGPQGGEYGVANHIADVLAELEIEIL